MSKTIYTEIIIRMMMIILTPFSDPQGNTCWV